VRSATVTSGRVNSPAEVAGWRCRKSRIVASVLARSASSITSIRDWVAMAATSEPALRSWLDVQDHWATA
jgi:hypothetical protein